MKKIALLGSTGSIGTQALDLCAAFPDRFAVTGLVGGRNVELLAEQVKRFAPEVAAVPSADDARRLSTLTAGTRTAVLAGDEGVRAVAASVPADIVLSAIAGMAGLGPTLMAVEAGRTVALANKEALVAAGDLLMGAARARGCAILPVDSEHSAIFQSLLGHDRDRVRRLILTASGGPFYGRTRDGLAAVTPAMALAHPTWKMGRKVTIDSATLMNKGFEVIEAQWLFGIPVDRIEILIHRQSVIHSMVEYVDGAIVAQMGIADMRVPIAYALAYPDRLALDLPALDLAAMKDLTFEAPDPAIFPAYTLAYRAARAGGTAPAVLCEADEVAVAAFLEGALPFHGMAPLIERVLGAHAPAPATSIEAITGAAAWARRTAEEMIRKS